MTAPTVDMAGARMAPGWYPDHSAGEAWERFWNGEDWTEGVRERVGRVRPRMPHLSDLATVRPRLPRVQAWPFVAAAALAGFAAVLVFGDGSPATSDVRPAPGTAAARAHASATAPRAVPPPPASTPGVPTGQARTWEVASVVDGRTLQLSNGAKVRLVGVAGGCAPGAATTWLREAVRGQAVGLVKPGADKDSAGNLLRYAAVGGQDVGLAMIQAGVATAEPGTYGKHAAYVAASHGCR
jgi:endonuclease YncB( thermonuclease family)